MLFPRFYTIILLFSFSLLCIAEKDDCDSRETKSIGHESTEDYNPRPAPRRQLHAQRRSEEETASKCPPGQSLISKKDIITMINYLESNLDITHDISKTHFPKAIAVRNKHITSLQNIQTELETRPEHLKHILEDIDGTRMRLEPIVDDLVSKLQEYNTYEHKFFYVYERAQNILESLEKYKLLCQFNNCDEPKLVMRQNNNRLDTLVTETELKTVKDEDYYCTSLTDLHRRIQINLTNFQHAYHDAMKGRIDGDNVMYAENIDNIRTKLKETGVSLFGMTMYDILNLQDDYHHYADNLKAKSNVTAEFNTIGKNALDVELKLIELEEGVAKYHQYCLNCKPKRRHALRDLFDNSPKPLEEKIETSPKIPDISTKYNNNKSTKYNNNESVPNIEEIINSLNVDELITAKIDLIKKVINNNYIKIFVGLDKKLNDPTLIVSYIEKLKPVKEMVRTELVVRQDAFMNLKNKLPEAKINQVYELSKKSMLLLASVKSAINFVNKYVY